MENNNNTNDTDPPPPHSPLHHSTQHEDHDVYGYNHSISHVPSPSSSSPQHLYHHHHHHDDAQLPYDVEEEDGRLWDELSHEQSREIQQHHLLRKQQRHHPLHHTNTSNHHHSNNNNNTNLKHKAMEAATHFKTAFSNTANYLHTTIQQHTTTTTTTERGEKKRGASELWNKPYRIQEENDVEEMHRLALAEFGLGGTTAAAAEGEEGEHDLSLKEEGKERQQSFSSSIPFFSSLQQTTNSKQQQQHELDTPLLSSSFHPSSSKSPSRTTTTTTEASYTFDKTGIWEKIIDTKSKFVFLSKYKLLPKRDGWAGVGNLDLFFTSLYNYYYHRGIIPIIGKGVVELVSLFFTLWLSVFLFAYLDWYKLAQCTDENTCEATLGDYIIEKPFSKRSAWNFLVILYCLLFLVYGAFSIATFLASVSDAFDSKIFFEDRLGICSRKLEGGAIEWDEIVRKIMELQKSGECRVAIHGESEEFDELTVAQRILRKENFMVAFINKGLLDLTVPLPWPLSKGGDGRSSTMFYSKSLEWSIYFCILSYMFNHKYKVRPTFYMDPASLKRRFVVCGVAHAVFMPFLLLFMMLHFFMSHMYDWRSSKQYLGPREWSDLAKWTFREFNELPHVFERRLGPSYKAAEDYLKLFTQSAAMASLGRALVFVSGSLGAVLVAFAAVNDSILLHVKIGQWNLLWYVGILGVIYSVGKGMLPDVNVHPPYARNVFAEIDNALVNVSTSTHYFPDIWKGRGWDPHTKKSFTEMFQYKAQLFALELLSVALAPVILCVSLPACAEKLCHFVHKAKIEVPGAGDVCGHSSFNFDAFEDESWEGTKMGRASEETAGVVSDPSAQTLPYSRQRNPEMKIVLKSRPKTRQGKMEKSFFSFKAAHPNWKCSSSGQSLIDRISSYQQEQERVLALEMQPHVEAAARQLETLRQLEGKGQLRQNPLSSGAGQINETYIRQNVKMAEEGAGADSGGGGIFPRSDVPDSAKGMRGIANDGSSPHVHFQNTDHSQVPFGGSSLTLVTEMSHEHHGDSQFSATPSQLSLGYGSSRSTSPVNLAAAASVLHYADIGLSTELRRILNRSTLDPDVSVAGSVFGTTLNSTIPSLSVLNPATNAMASTTGEDSEARERQAERQYLWLARYHSHLAEEHQ